MKPLYLSFCLAATSGSCLHVQAQTTPSEQAEPVPKVIVSATAEGWPARRGGASDSALLLSATPGYSVAQAGGVSGLPFINGLGDDRLKIRIDGMEITSACANHMNAPLSNIDPGQVGSIEVLAGVTPVSAGGDSIGGTITVKSGAAVFADQAGPLRTSGKLTLGGRHNGEQVHGALSASIASERISFAYDAAYARGHSYDDGNGGRVLSSLFESINQSAMLALRSQDQQLTLRAGLQHIPYQGFPNQYMDMTDNSGSFANLAYLGKFAFGDLDLSAYSQTTNHAMGFFSPERLGNMPMLTQGRNRGYAVKASSPRHAATTLRLGQEYHSFRLDDYWPAVPGSMMMGPQTYVNINGGQRDRLALYGEAETRHTRQWKSLLGARWESVRMDTGNVQPYAVNMMNMKDAAAAAAFNARSRRQRDSNLDLTALASFEADASGTYELGLARKTRSPNLYERYSWGRGNMSMLMTNWFGDGNGYVGDIDLKPETAYTLGLSARWHGDGEAGTWFVKLDAYHNRIDDYIDVDVLEMFNPYKLTSAQGSLLRFANHDAKLYGANLSWRIPLGAGNGSGKLGLTGNAAYTQGRRTDGGDLYHMMPLNALLALEHTSGAWINQLEAKVVARKARTDVRRLEPATAGYVLFNARSSIHIAKAILLSAGVNNLLDKVYADPMGGVYLSGLRAGGGALRPLPGYGRSLEIGLTVGF